MTEHKLMTADEKFAVWQQAWALREAGKLEEAMALDKTVPLPPFLAKFAKEHGLKDFLIRGGWNLAEAEAAFGQGWLNR